MHKFNKKGLDLGGGEDEISEIRNKKLETLASEAENKKRAFVKLQSILEEATNRGADSVELEFVDEGLEVTYIFGGIGIGSVVGDRMLESKIIELIVERAELQNKSRGVMNWTCGSKSYKIRVEEYDNFGESAFRLIPEKSRRKRA